MNIMPGVIIQGHNGMQIVCLDTDPQDNRVRLQMRGTRGHLSVTGAFEPAAIIQLAEQLIHRAAHIQTSPAETVI